jgi:hypothetical protein
LLTGISLTDVGLARWSKEMSQQRVASKDAARVTVDPGLIQFYSIELSPTADGRLAVGIIATICEHEGELEAMDLGSHRVDSIDDALAVIRHAFESVH